MKIPILTFVTEYQSSVCYLSYDTHHSCLISTEPDAEVVLNPIGFHC